MASSRAKRRTAYRKRIQNRFSMFLVTLVVMLILIVVAVKKVDLNETKNNNQARIEELKEQIAEAQLEAENIKKYAKYTQTKGFVEKIAHDKLGLVYENEIIFKEDD